VKYYAGFMGLSSGYEEYYVMSYNALQLYIYSYITTGIISKKTLLFICEIVYKIIYDMLCFYQSKITVSCMPHPKMCDKKYSCATTE
jgi:hypothetical protein